MIREYVGEKGVYDYPFIINVMDVTTARKLLSINHQFYQTLARSFSATRRRVQPGVRKILDDLPESANILDLGCGNGELARELARHDHHGIYIGLDFSPELLSEARKIPVAPLQAYFISADLSSSDWPLAIQHLQPLSSYYQPDRVFAFAVLHHLPGTILRRQVLTKVKELLSPTGQFIHSEWQFLNSERFRGRIQPWERVGINSKEVDAGDTLLDWRSGGYGLRYVHLFNENELDQLAKESGFTVQETFYSDGQGGRLSIYQVWQPG
jgi:SAM-dependent methyltransferase